MELNYHSARARQARLRNRLNQGWLRTVLWVVAAAIICLWVWSVFIVSEPLGNLLLIFVSLPLMLPLWWHAHLKNLPPARSAQVIDDVLEPELLGLLSPEVTPKKLAQLLQKTDGARFFGARFAISTDFLGNVVEDSTDIKAVWRSSFDLSRSNNEPYVTSASVLVALLFAAPEYQYYLSQLKLSAEDVLAGLGWHTHITSVIERARQQQKKGIGRDLSFGYAPLLNRFGLNITEEVEHGGLLHRKIEGHQETLSQIIHLLSRQGRRNATLVGQVGAGKTTLVYALAQQLITDKRVGKALRYQQIIALDSATLIANSKGKGQLEDLLIRLLNEAAKAKNVILFFDEAQLFLKEGTGSVDLSSILLPVLEGGGIKTIFALDEQEWLRLSRANPGLAQLMNRVAVTPLERDDTLRVLEDQVLLLEIQNQATYMYQSLHEAYQLAERFVQDQAFPGKAVKLLEAAAGFKEQQYFVTEKSVQQAVEKTYGVKVQVASEQSDRTALLNLEGKIHERMINQTRAVQVVSDALRRARAGVRNQQKPMGTFLFLGPTGVGKTELAKALAAVYFGGEDKLIRIDLNEYSQASDTSRLIATPSQYANSLSALVSKQPYSVILLDEIEKAHQSVLDVLLQVLDEGTLRDAENKSVSFRDAIIIATSNAGADKIRQHIEQGEQLEQFEDAFIDELITAQVFRPEFINRFDETVLFRPLTKPELVQVVDLILASINKTLASQKVSVELTTAAKEFLAEAGYDPRLGARPLRRVTQRSIENIVAGKLLSGEAGAGMTIHIDAPDVQAALSKRA